jgi:hypothetical protein
MCRVVNRWPISFSKAFGFSKLSCITHCSWRHLIAVSSANFRPFAVGVTEHA